MAIARDVVSLCFAKLDLAGGPRGSARAHEIRRYDQDDREPMEYLRRGAIEKTRTKKRHGQTPRPDASQNENAGAAILAKQRPYRRRRRFRVTK